MAPSARKTVLPQRLCWSQAAIAIRAIAVPPRRLLRRPVLNRMYSKRAIAIPPHGLGAIVRFEIFGVGVRLISRGRMAAIATVIQTASGQVLHVYAVGFVEDVVGFARVGLGVVLVAVDLAVVESVGGAAAAFALDAAVDGWAGEHC